MSNILIIFQKQSILFFLPTVFTLFIFSSSHAQQSAGDLKISPYVFEAANGQKVDAEFGRLVVPENRKKVKSRLIEVAFVRFKSTATNPKSPIIYLAGGPGGSGIDVARYGRFEMFMALREVADVVLLDQRGTGKSIPNLDCKETFDSPLDQPGSFDDLLRQTRDLSSLCAHSWREKGIDLTGYNTNENADDIEDLRKALGVEKINLLGISYGTHLSLTALKRHGVNIECVILAGVEGADHTYKLPSNIQLQLEAIVREIKTDPEMSKHIPNFLELMKRVLDRLEKKPETVEVTDPQSKQKVKLTIGKLDLQILTSNVMGDTQAISQLPAIYYAMDKGDFSIIAERVLLYRRSPLGSAMAYMMDCASGISDNRYKQIAKESKKTFLGATIDFPFPGVCSVWAQTDLGAGFRAPVKTSVPTLFISGTLDGRTPVSNAEEVRKGFSNSVQLIIERAGHSNDLLISSPRIAETMLAFLRGEKDLTTRITLPPLKWKPVTVQ